MGSLLQCAPTLRPALAARQNISSRSVRARYGLRPGSWRCAAAETRQESSAYKVQRSLQDLILSSAFLPSAAAWAQEEPLASPLDKPVVQETIKQTTSGGNISGWLILFSPLLAYGVFSVYRDKINPKAKLVNFAYVLAAAAILANIFSILVFKVRFF